MRFLIIFIFLINSTHANEAAVIKNIVILVVVILFLLTGAALIFDFKR